ncbi:NAD(P)-dependent oxidoreductase [Kineococcus gypseus]|uniref:NAD(P)-dependent oxidoreductase n=1 Tax=Kineococcus gypseus TaxID=1637102 RepID=UPI003D7D7B65
MVPVTDASPALPAVALLGTSTMGAGLARNLAAAGLPLTVWNRSPQKARPLAEVGARVAEDAADAVRGAQVVLTMLWDADSVEQTVRAAREGFAPGAVWVQTSTVGVEGTERLARLAGELGLRFVDAPVLGTKGPAEQGALTVLAGGDEQELGALLEPVFAAIAQRVLWVGAAGAGSRLKLACNAWVLTVVDGVATSLALARDLGVDPRLFLEAVRGGAMDSPYVQGKGAAMLEGRHEPQFGAAGAAKDLELVLAAAAGAGSDAAVTRAVHEHFAAVVAAGHGGQDVSAVWFAHEREG